MLDLKRRRDGADISTEPTVASILGLSSPIRFRLHGSSQKAHLVLRRVQVSNGSDDDENAVSGSPTTAFYSFFAHKRIEVKPGKEILLAIEGEFNERAVLIGGDFSGFQHSDNSTPVPTPRKGSYREDSKLEGNEGIKERAAPSPQHEVAVMANEEEKERDLLLSVPPKMRKSWMKGRRRLPDLEPPDPLPTPPAPPLREDVGVQAQPEYASVVVEATPIPGVSCATQTSNEATAHDGQFADEPVVPFTPYTVPTTRDIVSLQEPAPDNPEPESEGSLSPMEMSSTPSTPEHHPVNPPLSPFPALSNPEFPSQGRKFLSSLPPDRPISPSSSASSAPDELDIKLITEINKPVDTKSVTSLPSSPPTSLQSPVLSSSRPPPDTRNTPLFRTSAIASSGENTSDHKPLVPSSSGLLHGDDSKRTVIRSADPVGTRTADTSWNVPTPNSMGPYHPRPPQGGRSGQDMFALWGTAATGSWGTPSPASNSRAGNLSSPSGSGMGSKMRNSRQLAQTRAGDKPGRTPPDLKSLVSLSSGPTDNPLGIRPSNARARPRETAPPPIQRPSLDLPTLEGKRGLVIGSFWPPKSRSTAAPSNGAPSLGQTSADSIAPPTTNEPSMPQWADSVDSNPEWERAREAFLNSRRHSTKSATEQFESSAPLDSSSWTDSVDSSAKWGRAREDKASSLNCRRHSIESTMEKSEPLAPLNSSTWADSVDSSAKWGRLGEDEASSLNSRHHSIDSTAEKSEPLADSVVSRTGSQSAAGGHANGNVLLQHPNFVGYTPPTKHLGSASTKSLNSGSQSETSPRGIKRSASTDVDTSTKAASPVAPSKRILRWPTNKPIHTVQIQGKSTDVRSIVFNSDGSQFAVCCNDSSVRIWNNVSHLEVAKLAHVAPVVSVAWMDGDSGVVSLGDTGEVSKWSRVGGNQWHWAKLLDASSDHRPGADPTSFAYMKDRIAIAFPRVGVKVWLWVKGMWQPQRSILRQNVTSIKFVEEGEALLGGTADGVLWYCQIPNGTLRAYNFFKSGVYLLDVSSTGNHLLVSRNGGVAHLVSVVQDDRTGKTEREYSLKDEAPIGSSGQGAMFTNGGQSVMFGTVQGCLLVWDKSKVISGLDHGEDATIQAVANFDPRRNFPGHLITGTKNGVLSWWEYPPMMTADSNKRVRTQ